MISNYLLLLYKQFCNSVGKKYCEYNILNDPDFAPWIINLKKSSQEYADYLSYLGLFSNKNGIVEINKGKFDTLGLEEISIVSPFAQTIDLKNRSLFVSDSIPIIQSGPTLYDASNVDYFITHNPYSIYYTGELDQIHMLGHNICFGVFGKEDDSDKILKLKELERFASTLDEQCGVYYETNNDYYFGCVKSERKIKVNKLIKTR